VSENSRSQLLDDVHAARSLQEAGNPLAFERRLELPDHLHERGYRTRDLWRVMHVLNELTTLSSVPDEYRAKLIHAKDLTTLITVIIDDVVDDGRDPDVLQELVRLLQRVDDEIPAYPEGDERIELAALAWRTVVSILREAPRYEEFLDLWLFDMAELVQCQRYNMLINERPAMASTEEYLVYGTHNFNVKPHMTMDLMFSPGFKEDELGVFRRALQHIQVAVQLVNDLFTLEREIGRERSVASYPIIVCIEEGGKPEDLRWSTEPIRSLSMSRPRAIIEEHIRKASVLLLRMTSFDGARLLKALGTVEEVYRRNRGRI
jgi:hypothetical protein